MKGKVSHYLSHLFYCLILRHLGNCFSRYPCQPGLRARVSGSRCEDPTRTHARNSPGHIFRSNLFNTFYRFHNFQNCGPCCDDYITPQRVAWRRIGDRVACSILWANCIFSLTYGVEQYCDYEYLHESQYCTTHEFRFSTLLYRGRRNKSVSSTSETKQPGAQHCIYSNIRTPALQDNSVSPRHWHRQRDYNVSQVTRLTDRVL